MSKVMRKTRENKYVLRPRSKYSYAEYKQLKSIYRETEDGGIKRAMYWAKVVGKPIKYLVERKYYNVVTSKGLTFSWQFVCWLTAKPDGTYDISKSNPPY
jgi:hypothetical protein